MKVFFLDRSMVQRPTAVFLTMFFPLVWHVTLQGLLPAILLAGVIAIYLSVTSTPGLPVFASSMIGGGLTLAVGAAMGVTMVIHELGHVFAGARLVGPDYPKALVIPTFKSPFIRFAPGRSDVSPTCVVLIMLMGALSGLFVLALMLVTILIWPGASGSLWIWGCWLAMMSGQVMPLVPAPDSDGDKIRRLMREYSVTWRSLGKTAWDMFRK